MDEIKNKAMEIFNMFREIPPSSPYTGIHNGEVKQSALIAVNLIIDKDGYNNDYWQKVKNEINNK